MNKTMETVVTTDIEKPSIIENEEGGSVPKIVNILNITLTEDIYGLTNV